MTKKDTLIIAHRGLHNNSIKENTKEAFVNAIEENIPIELDIHIIKDNTIVVFHDDNLKRMYDIDKKVYEYNYDELLKDSNNEIITLKEVLDLVEDKVPLIIELKVDYDDYRLEKELVKILDNYKGRFSIKSFNVKSMIWFKNHRKNYTRGLLISNKYNKLLQRLLLRYNIKRVDPDYLSVNYKLLDKKYINNLKEKIKVYAWTIKDKDKYNKYVDRCDGLICENIDKGEVL